jgi:ABC-2 type transport system ATP-binding protein
MDEAERLCDRLCVMSRGRVVAEGTPAGLVSRYGGGTRVRFATPDGLDPSAWARLPGVRAAARVDEQTEVGGPDRS